MARATLLLLSQDPDTADLYACSLSKAGFDVRQAQVPGIDPDLVILHFHPRRDASSLVAAVRKDMRRVPVIALTAFAQRIEPSLFDSVLVFPVLPDELVRTVVATLNAADEMLRWNRGLSGPELPTNPIPVPRSKSPTLSG